MIQDHSAVKGKRWFQHAVVYTLVIVRLWKRRSTNDSMLTWLCLTGVVCIRRQAKSPTKEGSGYEIRDKREETRGVSHAREV